MEKQGPTLGLGKQGKKNKFIRTRRDQIKLAPKPLSFWNKGCVRLRIDDSNHTVGSDRTIVLIPLVKTELEIKAKSKCLFLVRSNK